MRALPSPLRRQLETTVLSARRAAEGASRAAIDGLGVFLRDRPAHLDADRAELRNGLRAKWRQLGGGEAAQPLLIAECAYEQWHRLMFARFLAENGLLLHPRFKAPVTLSDCEDLAAELGEPDGWSVAARFAAEILPGIFRLDDPCVRLRLAPEGRHALEQILDGLPGEVFAAADALGWVYQFWQKDKKEEVNNSERKVGGADLGPVTQLFTENYMVRFLLENSLGAWWVARHPDSPLVKDFEYLRFNDDNKPAAGLFDGWPGRVAEITVMDPCCGSGHFLVEAFSMLWQMRSEEEALSPVEAQDAVLRDNLFGLEIDSRCVQIAMFAVALQAWKAGGGWRQLPVPSIACSGIPVKAPVDEWKALAGGNQRIENALTRLHILFRDADTLGSLIDPKSVTGTTDATGHQTSLEDVDFHEVAPLIQRAAVHETADPATRVMGAYAASVVRSADFLARHYTLIATNVPYLTGQRHVTALRDFADRRYSKARADLATVMITRWLDALRPSGVLAVVSPLNWAFQPAYRVWRRWLLSSTCVDLFAPLGEGGFESSEAAGAFISLTLLRREDPRRNATIIGIDAVTEVGRVAIERTLRSRPYIAVPQASQLANPDSRVTLRVMSTESLLDRYADSYYGVGTGDSNRFVRAFWECTEIGVTWVYFQGFPTKGVPYSGRTNVFRWELGRGELARFEGAYLRNQEVWSSAGVVVGQTRNLPAALHDGNPWDSNCAVIVPKAAMNLPAIWAFCSSDVYSRLVRELDSSLKVMNHTLLKVPFDVDHWRKVAGDGGPLPEPWSDDPTQWLFKGRPDVSTAPLQVAVARLAGYRWPEQAEFDDLDPLADTDGIVCLPSVAGEAPAADRVQQLLAAAFSQVWSPAMVKELLEHAGSKKRNLADWLRDEFFRQHCALFGNRPFVWHIWDGQRDGFSALVNYHRLDRKLLEKLTYGYLGQDWVERLRDDVRDEVAGAEARLSGALNLQRKLEAIINGEKPYDIYVRWKELHEQPVGWEPDLNDGVRLNIRPFVEAGVLRAPFNVHWHKDRGKNPDGTERHNDIHLTLAEKIEARKQAGRA